MKLICKLPVVIVRRRWRWERIMPGAKIEQYQVLAK
jgi:hypothetical protein